MKTYIKYSLGLLRMLLTLNTLFACVRTQQGMDRQEKSSAMDIDIDKPLDTQQGVDAQENPLDSVVNKQQRTALGRAIEQNKCSTVEMLLKYARTDINNAGGDVTSLVLACELKRWGSAKTLLNHSRNQELDVKTPDPELRKTPLHWAAQEGSVEVVTLLLDPKYKDKVDVNAVDKDDNTALHLAAENGHKDVVEGLVQRGIKVNAVDKDGNTALHLATYGNRLGVFKFLLEQPDINVNLINNEGSTLCHAAAQEGFGEVITLLLDSNKYEIGVNVKDNDGDTALHLAAENGHKTIVEYLLGALGIEVNEKNEYGWISLHSAAYGGDAGVMKTLLENKKISVHVNQKNLYGQSPIYVAASKGHLEVIEVLHAWGANPNLQAEDNTIPLHKAAEGGYLKVVKYLVEEAQSDIHKKNKQDQTPLDLARDNEHLDVVNYLVNYLKENAPVPKA